MKWEGHETSRNVEDRRGDPAGGLPNCPALGGVLAGAAGVVGVSIGRILGRPYSSAHKKTGLGRGRE